MREEILWSVRTSLLDHIASGSITSSIDFKLLYKTEH